MSDLISKLSDLRSQYNCFDDNEREVYEALSEAIKALSAEPEERALHESCTDCPLYDHDRHNCPRFNRVIPTAILDAQPRKGKWERHYSRPGVYADMYWHCSVCGYKNADSFANVYHHYCPSCGALMSEGEDDD